MTHDVSRFLADPKPGMTLAELAGELNELAKVRNTARLAFCRRIAEVYLLIVGHRPRTGVKVPAFYKWCDDNIRSASGKPYTFNSIRNYVKIGFAEDQRSYWLGRQRLTVLYDQKNRIVGAALKRAIRTDSPPSAIPITKLKEQGLPTDVATEVNVLMTAWEQASSQARSQFMYMITGKRIAA